MASTTTAATTARSSFSGFAAGAGIRARRWHGFGQQRLMLQRVEETGLGIAACPLPARDDRAGRFVELSVGLGVEAEARQPALHVFTPCPVEADLIFGFLGCFLGKDHHWIDGFRQVAGGRARTVLQRGDLRQGDRFELTVGKAGQIGTEFASPVRILDRTPELEFNLRSGAGRGSLRIPRNGGSGTCGRRNRIEINGAGQIGIAPGQLRPPGLFMDLAANLRHRLLNLDSRLGDMGQQRPGERAVGADLAIERGLSRAGGERDQGAFAGFHFGQTRLHRNTARAPGGLGLGGKGIVAAGIEEHQLDLGGVHGLVEGEIDVDRVAELDIDLGFDVGIDRQQVVDAVNGDAMAGIKKHSNIRALGFLAEFEQPLGHLVAGEIDALDHIETCVAEQAGHRRGIDRRVRKRRRILVGAVADDKGDAPVGFGGIRTDENPQDRQCKDQQAHGPIFPDLKSGGVWITLNSSFVAEQLLSGSLVPERAPIVTPHCTTLPQASPADCHNLR